MTYNKGSSRDLFPPLAGRFAEEVPSEIEKAPTNRGLFIGCLVPKRGIEPPRCCHH